MMCVTISVAIAVPITALLYYACDHSNEHGSWEDGERVALSL